MVWDGIDRRGTPRIQCGSCADLASRVSYLEAYRETHEKSIDNLTRAVEGNNALLSKTIEGLAAANIQITKVKSDQRNTHVLVGLFGAFLGGALETVGKKILGG